MPVTNFDPIATSEIAVFADIDAVTFGKLKNRDEHLKEIVSANIGSPKIPAEAIANQTAGSGLGLESSQFNHVVSTISSGAIASTTPVDVITTIPINPAREISFEVTAIAGGGTYAITIEPLWTSLSTFLYVRFIRDAGGVGTQTLSVNVHGRTF